MPSLTRLYAVLIFFDFQLWACETNRPRSRWPKKAFCLPKAISAGIVSAVRCWQHSFIFWKHVIMKLSNNQIPIVLAP